MSKREKETRNRQHEIGYKHQYCFTFPLLFFMRPSPRNHHPLHQPRSNRSQPKNTTLHSAQSANNPPWCIARASCPPPHSPSSFPTQNSVVVNVHGLRRRAAAALARKGRGQGHLRWALGRERLRGGRRLLQLLLMVGGMMNERWHDSRGHMDGRVRSDAQPKET